mmetsp:Transcript_63074/g.160059  ORF Transcript_63074/g.160059 Transcript_63074/m.160059 type:complete len:213 (+) Transcript_63074:854-1492(+)
MFSVPPRKHGAWLAGVQLVLSVQICVGVDDRRGSNGRQPNRADDRRLLLLLRELVRGCVRAHRQECILGGREKFQAIHGVRLAQPGHFGRRRHGALAEWRHFPLPGPRCGDHRNPRQHVDTVCREVWHKRERLQRRERRLVCLQPERRGICRDLCRCLRCYTLHDALRHRFGHGPLLPHSGGVVAGRGRAGLAGDLDGWHPELRLRAHWLHL